MKVTRVFLFVCFEKYGKLSLNYSCYPFLSGAQDMDCNSSRSISIFNINPKKYLKKGGIIVCFFFLFFETDV